MWGVAPLPPSGGVACLGVFWVLFFVLEPFSGWFWFGSGPVLKPFCTGSGRRVSQVVGVAEGFGSCRSRDDAHVRETLDAFWEKPGDAIATLGSLRRGNQGLYSFEEKL